MPVASVLLTLCTLSAAAPVEGGRVGNLWAAAVLPPSRFGDRIVRIRWRQLALARRRGASTAICACMCGIRPAPIPTREGGSGGPHGSCPPLSRAALRQPVSPRPLRRGDRRTHARTPHHSQKPNSCCTSNTGAFTALTKYPSPLPSPHTERTTSAPRAARGLSSPHAMIF